MSRAKGIQAWREVLKCDPCAYCGGPSGGVDHIEPRERDGSNDGIENLTAVCIACNSQKGRKSLLEYLPVRKRPLMLKGFSSLEGRFDLPAEMWVVKTAAYYRALKETA